MDLFIPPLRKIIYSYLWHPIPFLSELIDKTARLKYWTERNIYYSNRLINDSTESYTVKSKIINFLDSKKHCYWIINIC